MKRKLPDHIPGTIRNWRKKKRAQLRQLNRALWAFRGGVAYVPGYSYLRLESISKIIEEFQTAMSQKHWGK